MTKTFCDLCGREIADNDSHTPIKKQIQMRPCIVEVELRVSFPQNPKTAHCCYWCAVDLVADQLDFPDPLEAERK